jgi:hypothetical protein
MGTILWKNLGTVPACECEALAGLYDELGHLLDGYDEIDVIYVYLRRGGVIEVRPATGVRLSGQMLQVLNGEDIVARYPRERVVQASHQLVEPPPFC